MLKVLSKQLIQLQIEIFSHLNYLCIILSFLLSEIYISMFSQKNVGLALQNIYILIVCLCVISKVIILAKIWAKSDAFKHLRKSSFCYHRSHQIVFRWFLYEWQENKVQKWTLVSKTVEYPVQQNFYRIYFYRKHL